MLALSPNHFPIERKALTHGVFKVAGPTAPLERFNNKQTH
jgi:hypothetical protein